MSQRSFNPEILRKDGAFCVFLPEWNLGAEAATLEEAYRKFEEQRLAMETRAQKFGLSDVSPEPYPAARRRGLLEELGVFFLKTATLTFAVIFVGILLLPHIGAAVRNQVAPTAMGKLNQWALDFPAKLNARLDRVTPEEQQQMLEQWGKLLRRSAAAREQLSRQMETKKEKP